jgi:hypothetical protein
MAVRYTGHNTNDGTGRYVDQIVIELVKGQRHIECTGQQDIDPEIVIMRAITAALHDDKKTAGSYADSGPCLRPRQLGQERGIKLVRLPRSPMSAAFESTSAENGHWAF